MKTEIVDFERAERRRKMRREKRSRPLGKKRKRRKKKRPRRIVNCEKETGTRCMRARERKVQSDLEINKLGRGRQDGGMGERGRDK